MEINIQTEEGALVHRDCHPKRKEDVRRFREWWNSEEKQNAQAQEEEERNGQGDRLRFPPPEGTECRFTYGGTSYEGIIRDRKLQVDGESYTSFSGASCGVTNTNRNGWQDWKLKLPGRNDWILADNWRRGRGL